MYRGMGKHRGAYRSMEHYEGVHSQGPNSGFLNSDSRDQVLRNSVVLHPEVGCTNPIRRS